MSTVRMHALFVALAALVAAGCGGGGSETADPASPPGSSAPPPTVQKHALTVALSGSGSVSSAPAGISCGADCSESYDQGTSVTLSAVAASGQHFDSWSGACSGNSSSCTLTMSTARDVGARFVANTPPADTQAPSVPGNLAAQASAIQVSLSWNASTDNVGVQGYEVFRDDMAGALAQPATTSYVDSAVSASTTYGYRVRARDAAGNISGFSNAASATVPSPPPGGVLKGWQLNETNIGLAPHGLTCASLPVYTGPEKPAPGTTITEKRIEGYLDLSAGDITVERSCIRPTTLIKGGGISGTTDVNRCTATACPPPPALVTIRDSEIDGSAVTDNEAVAFSCAFAGIADLYRNYMHDTGSGICFDNSGPLLSATVEHNYVTRMRAWGDAGTTGSHNESMTVRDFDPRALPERRLTIRNNRFVSKSGNDSGAFFIQAFAGYIDQVRIESNLLESFNYGMPLEFRHNGYGNDMRSIDNRFVITPGSPGAGYVDGGPGWAEWRDNYYYDAAALDGKGSPVATPTP